VVTDRSLSDDILVSEIDAPRQSYKELAHCTHDFQGAAESQPAWNPQGVYIALVTNLWPGRLPERGRRPVNRDPMAMGGVALELSAGPGPSQVFVMTDNGRKKGRVSNPRRSAHFPAWTVDGTGLLYVLEAEAGAAGGQPEIWLHRHVVRVGKRK